MWTSTPEACHYRHELVQSQRQVSFMSTRRRSVSIRPPTGRLQGQITLPGSKSITNRALLIAALANGTSTLTGALSSDDTLYMAEALRQMGASVAQDTPTVFSVTGRGALTQPSVPLFLGNAGTAMRFLTAAAATVRGTVVIDGDAHMRRRPIGPLVAALRSLGVEAYEASGCPPVTVHGIGGFTRDQVEIDGSLSSQFISAIMMTAACGPRPLNIVVPRADIGGRGYINITAAVMAAFGGHVVSTGEGAWRVEPTGFAARSYAVEPDASAATYLWAAERLTRGRLELGADPDLMSQPDAKAYSVIQTFPRMPTVIDGAQMQDAVPTLAVMAAFNETPVRFTGIANLRVKECDRVSALATELSRIRPGLATEDGDDLIVNADPGLTGLSLPTEIHTYSDHRIAMSFALAGLRLNGIRIVDPDCAAKTYPNYWNDLATLGVQLEFA
jgi:3-phosphoshikimate 1-carboxyvinyltransferase